MTSEIPYSPMMRPPDPPPFLEAMRYGPVCKECGGPLGKTFHVVNSVAKCEGCFVADVAQVNVERNA